MSRLLAEWRERKGREEEQLHEQLCAAIRAGQVQVYTDPRLLDFQGSPVHQHWDHLLPLTIEATLALVVLLATGIATGIIAMTLCVLAHLYGNKYYVAWRLKTRALAYLLGSYPQFVALWQLGGIALVVKGVNEAPCLAPKGDWRKFIRRNLGEGEPQAQAPMANAPVPAGPRMTAPPAQPAAAPAPPSEAIAEPAPVVMETAPLADAVQPAPSPAPSPAAAPEIMAPPAPKPGDRWASIADEDPPRDEVVPKS
ncbi:hypothetical protein H261_08148 [Paramagnetospirillum caucaseum]|uniref:Uncharacterized protein n=1 Tax=Paramagnetospirillum caucaseum TaxID=1244869 RepID=M3ACB0_9PROT|nr:hypothetical protein [Paramagnetospirillum caucaseum]EME70438.1 hypothetical protein H261_08148 [Paramagnetospirillum caucaseum]